ncbi:hypothetical protein DDB_G0292928 [Dictyostelium discoideum AX4]|uniref:Probable nucleoside diphosphate kinase DDB_G0292928 n=1 Tax=Dictyostelium discoideum TaxID=44689 RepID=Y2928_DICDI|nr:hypothetical protein DDB_G0292928 [Dictyostelium discoideum AX4]Q54CG9.1 RecName: Full=Probable nucleoside diphosphate kinase DDB_G0292928 [Dictyostelium discoideum]EAL61013.1 hypothetical protein DDB_G0292928 [Dictyostelium discoideum AX4]|eukprot:XP_629447.1 hypothetical protein DDB_G0292928 [Dictyostelium discoideum AX4]
MNKFKYTLAIIKPDILVKQNQNVDKIINKIESKFIIHQRKQIKLSLEEAEQFYKDHRGKFFYERLISFMTRGDIIPLILSDKSLEINNNNNNNNNNTSIKPWRDFIGPTHRDKAREQIGCLRGEYGTSDTRNAFHGSGSEEEAIDEINFFFPHFLENNKK